MSSFGSSAINKSGKKPVPKAARRRPGTAGESQSASLPATPALSAVSVASSEEPPTHLLTGQASTDESQRLPEESLITHAANDSSHAARDEAEVHLQHRSEELVTEQEQDGTVQVQELSSAAVPSAGNTADEIRESSHIRRPGDDATLDNTASAGPLGDRRIELRAERDEHAASVPDTARLEQPQVQQQLIDETSRLSSRSGQSDQTTQGAPTASMNAPLHDPMIGTTAGAGLSGVLVQDESRASTQSKRKRVTGIKALANKRPRHLQTSGEITLESMDNEVQQSIENTEQTQPAKKPRKIRKDKGIPRKKPSSAVSADGQQSGDAALAIAPTPGRELRQRPTATPHDADEREATELSGGEGFDAGEKQRRKRKKRKVTPDGNEDVQIDPAEAQMIDMLNQDSKIGKLSTIEKRMREIDWAEVKRKRMEARNPPEVDEDARHREGSNPDGEDGEQATAGANDDDADDDIPDSAPVRQRTRMVNGVITVVDEASHVDRHAEGDAEMETLEVVEHEDLTERINSNSWIDANRRDPIERKHGRKKADPWNLRDTDKFYEALRMFGTDFFVIAKMFKGKTRRQVKMKFVREEHDDPDRVKRALHGERKLLDLEAFKMATGITHFKSPEEIHRELAEDMRAREEEIVRAREEYEETERQRKVLEAGGVGENGESAKENEVPGAKGKKKAKNKGKHARGPVETADQAAEVVEVLDE